MKLDSLPPCELNASIDVLRQSLQDARDLVAFLKSMAEAGCLGRDGSFTVGDVTIPLDEWRMYAPAVDEALTLVGDPFYAGPFPTGLLANARKSAPPRPAKFVLPADRLSDRPLGEFVAMARRRDGDGWATVKKY